MLGRAFPISMCQWCVRPFVCRSLRKLLINIFRVGSDHGIPGKSWNSTKSFKDDGKSWNAAKYHGKSWNSTFHFRYEPCSVGRGGGGEGVLSQSIG